MLNNLPNVFEQFSQGVIDKVLSRLISQVQTSINKPARAPNKDIKQ